MSSIYDDVNPNYLIQLETNNFRVVTARMPDTFSIDVQSDWAPRLQEILSNWVDNAKSAAGATFSQFADIAQGGIEFQKALKGNGFQSKYLSSLSWQGTQPLSMNIPFLFDAERDAFTDVMLPAFQLMALAAPVEISQDNVRSQAASGFTSIFDSALQIAADTIGKNIESAGFLAAPGPRFWGDDQDRITLNVGRMMTIPSVIVTAVNAQFASKFDVNGFPIAADVQVTISTHYTPSRKDLESWFGIDLSAASKSSAVGYGNSAPYQNGGKSENLSKAEKFPLPGPNSAYPALFQSKQSTDEQLNTLRNIAGANF